MEMQPVKKNLPILELQLDQHSYSQNKAVAWEYSKNAVLNRHTPAKLCQLNRLATSAENNASFPARIK